MKSVVEKFIEELKAKDDILGVLIFGSYVRGDQRENSDVDFLVVTKSSTFRDVETREGQVFEIVYSSLNDAKAFYENNPDNAVRQWNDGKIVFDRNGEMEELRSFVATIKEKGKAELTVKQKAHLRFDAEDRISALEYLKEQDFPTANSNLYLLANSLLDLYFNLKRKWAPAPKQSLKVLRINDPAMARLFDSFYSSQEFEEQMQITKQIIKDLFE